MNSTFKVTSSLYTCEDSGGSLPPDGVWNDESLQAGPSVKMVGERWRVDKETGVQLTLEDGTTLAKSHENKTWKWFSEEAEDPEGIGTGLSSEGRLPTSVPQVDTSANGNSATEVSGGSAPSGSAPSAALSKSQPATENGHDEDTVPSIEELLASIEHDELGDHSEEQDDFFVLGRETSTAIMSAEWMQRATLTGSVVVGRGSQYNFANMRQMGAAMALGCNPPEKSSS